MAFVWPKDQRSLSSKTVKGEGDTWRGTEAFKNLILLKEINA